MWPILLIVICDRIVTKQEQVLEEGEGTDEIEYLRARKDARSHVEGPKGGRESGKRGERHLRGQVVIQIQLYHTREGRDASTFCWILLSSSPETIHD